MVVRMQAAGSLVVTAGRIELDSAAELHPGAEAAGSISPRDPDCWVNVGPGLELDLCEGEQLVGKALVVGELEPRAT